MRSENAVKCIHGLRIALAWRARTFRYNRKILQHWTALERCCLEDQSFRLSLRSSSAPASNIVFCFLWVCETTKIQFLEQSQYETIWLSIQCPTLQRGAMECYTFQVDNVSVISTSGSTHLLRNPLDIVHLRDWKMKTTNKIVSPFSSFWLGSALSLRSRETMSTAQSLKNFLVCILRHNCIESKLLQNHRIFLNYPGSFVDDPAAAEIILFMFPGGVKSVWSTDISKTHSSITKWIQPKTCKFRLTILPNKKGT